MLGEPIIEITGLRREYPSGEGAIAALAGVDLTIRAGEMVAIVGASGSGKSTLMNILGCLDRPTAGTYRVFGRDVSDLDADELAALRRRHFGFIFQRYHLLGELSAAGNVELPAGYAGARRRDRATRADALLDRLGMRDRANHRPGQLSGGQQQRVSIARALMNGADVILADEPTGALDRRTGDELLRLLEELRDEGRTVIIVTHDTSVASRAERLIEITDGLIASDGPTPGRVARTTDGSVKTKPMPVINSRDASWRAAVDRLWEAFATATRSMAARRMRTVLTMLGIIIGIASVVSVVALGEGSRQKVLDDISSLGTNTLEVFPGADFGDPRSGRIRTLTAADAEELAGLAFVAAVTPTVSTSATARRGAKEASALVNGVGEGYFAARGSTLLAGRFFDATSRAGLALDAVIDTNTRDTLFSDGADPIGQVILVGRVPCRVVGVAKDKQGGFGSSRNLSIYLPHTTVQARFLGSTSLRSITVRVKDDVEASRAEAIVVNLLTRRHGVKDFSILNTDDIRKTITGATETLTLLIGAVAVISLVVGGIGVMNIMLVSVSERVNEIGVRMAVGARRNDILRQFLIEAVLICLTGGVLGIAAALGFGVVFNALVQDYNLVTSPIAIVAAVVCSCGIGLVFGYLPARDAARLDPVIALARD